MHPTSRVHTRGSLTELTVIARSCSHSTPSSALDSHAKTQSIKSSTSACCSQAATSDEGDRVSDVLRHHSIKSCIKKALLLSGGPAGFNKLQALQQLQVCGVVDELIKAAAAQSGVAEQAVRAHEAAQPAGRYQGQSSDTALQLVPQQQFRPGPCYLHVVVKGGRAFAEYLTRSALPGEQLQLHLLLQGQRISSVPVTAGTSPAVKAEAIIQLPAMPTAGGCSGRHRSSSGDGVTPVKAKAPWVFAEAAAAGAAAHGTIGGWDDSSGSPNSKNNSNSSSSIEPQLQHLLQLHERLHIVVVNSTPLQAAEGCSYSEVAAAAAATVAAQQCAHAISPQQQQQLLQQLCCQHHLYGVGALDWRKVLARKKGPYITVVELRPGQPDELQSSAAVGAVELHLQLLTHHHQRLQQQQQPGQQQDAAAAFCRGPVTVGQCTVLPESVVQLQQQCELRAESEALVEFIKRAKVWWAEYLAINPRLKHRNIKVLARCEAGCQHPVAAWLTPLQLGRCLSTAAEAARFVALLGVRQQCDNLPGAVAGAGGSAGCWASLHTCLAARQATEEELALLLCSILLGFGLNAWVANARLQGNTGAAASWVLVYDDAAPDSSILWDATTGLRHGVRDLQSLPFSSIDSIFNHRQLLANRQLDNCPAAINWQLQDADAWFKLDMSEPALHQPLKRLAFPVRPPSMSPWVLEQQLEQQVMAGLAAAQWQLQQDLQGPTATAATAGASSRAGITWDAALAHIVMPALAAYETEALLGVSPAAASEVAAAVRRTTPTGFTFKGVPQHHRTLAAPRILNSLLCLPLVREMLLLPWAVGQQQRQHSPNQDAAGVVYALRVKVTLYPEDLASVWLMFAVQYRGTDC